MSEKFDMIEYGIEHYFIEVLPVENNAWTEYRINPRKILSEDLLHRFLMALSDKKFDVYYHKKDKVFYATNKGFVKQQENEETTRKINNREKVDNLCEECLEPYLALRNNYIGSVMAISEITEITPIEAAAILCTKLYEEMEDFCKEGKGVWKE